MRADGSLVAVATQVSSAVGTLLAGVAAAASTWHPKRATRSAKRSQVFWWTTFIVLAVVTLALVLTWHPWRHAAASPPPPPWVVTPVTGTGTSIADGFQFVGDLSPATLRGKSIWLLARDIAPRAGGTATLCLLRGSRISCPPVSLAGLNGTRVSLSLVTADQAGAQALNGVDENKPLTAAVAGVTLIWQHEYRLETRLSRKDGEAT